MMKTTEERVQESRESQAGENRENRGGLGGELFEAMKQAGVELGKTGSKTR
jgi:hypothetical protein